MINRIRELNKDIEIYDIADDDFSPYGRVLTGLPFNLLEKYMQECTEVPIEGNIYEASVLEMEKTDLYEILSHTLYGELPVQIGYCNGNNSFLNALEYHKGSEITYAVTDIILLLGHVWDIKNNNYDSSLLKAFYIPAGSAVEIYSTTLHFAPCRIDKDGFKSVIVLPAGTNHPLENSEKKLDAESELLFMANKWLIAHPEAVNMINRNAVVGITGRNIEINID